MPKMIGAEISATTPQPSSAKWSGRCHNAHRSDVARLMIDVIREELDVLLDYFKPITSEELDELVMILRSALQKAEDQRRELWREQDLRSQLGIHRPRQKRGDQWLTTASTTKPAK
jgi:hypothetical protein